MSNDFYSVQRNRFISSFKKEKLGSCTEEDMKIIGEGTTVAHGGDARLDATLYTRPGGRTDIKTFEKLYGIAPQMIERIGCVETFTVLNTHAGVIASNQETGSDRFYRRFWVFVKLFKESGAGYDESYLVGAPTDVTRAYRAFMKCISTDVSSRGVCN
ncbi:hypothetical protein HOY82DRAFT_476433 [Tuber indicum]|nr:hypothetical protein HOY82DRAFT_476433 [Tuber indicum]